MVLSLASENNNNNKKMPVLHQRKLSKVPKSPHEVYTESGSVFGVSREYDSN